MTKSTTPKTASGSKSPNARERILDAAAMLMTVKAPSQITGRELAKAAEVNYGLIHHYFGGKDLACRDAFRQLAGKYVQSAQAHVNQDWILSMGDLPEYQDLWKILAHAAMDGESLAMLGWDYPLLRARLEARAKENGSGSATAVPKANIATAFSLALGWTVFQPFIKEALGLEPAEAADIGETIVERIAELW